MADLFTLRPAALSALLQSKDGVVGRDLTRRVLKVHKRAKELCPVDTGRLRSSIRWTIGRDARGLVGLVGTDVNYALFVHEGTRYMAGRPFLREALNEALGEAAD